MLCAVNSFFIENNTHKYVLVKKLYEENLKTWTEEQKNEISQLLEDFGKNTINLQEREYPREYYKKKAGLLKRIRGVKDGLSIITVFDILDEYSDHWRFDRAVMRQIASTIKIEEIVISFYFMSQNLTFFLKKTEIFKFKCPAIWHGMYYKE